MKEGVAMHTERNKKSVIGQSYLFFCLIASLAGAGGRCTPDPVHRSLFGGCPDFSVCTAVLKALLLPQAKRPEHLRTSLCAVGLRHWASLPAGDAISDEQTENFRNPL